MNKQLATLLEKEVSRKEFLGLFALAVGSIFGFGTLIRLLTGHSLGGQHLSGGYGSSAYGGGKEQ